LPRRAPETTAEPRYVVVAGLIVIVSEGVPPAGAFGGLAASAARGSAQAAAAIPVITIRFLMQGEYPAAPLSNESGAAGSV
jgi:hypothetical protein